MAGDLVITTEAPVGATAPYPAGARYLLTRRVMALRTFGIQTQYLQAALNSGPTAAHIKRHSRGATVPRILKPRLLEAPIPLPPAAEQERIVTRLDEFASFCDETEQICRKRLDCLNQLRQSVLRKAFTGELTANANEALRGGSGMNEAETRAELIDPAIKDAGWGVVEGSRVRREVITIGRLQGAGKRSAKDIADYVLVYRGHKLAVIEAKRKDAPDTEGVGQAKKYASMLQTRFTYSTNGSGIYRIDMETGEEGYVDKYPTPDELWAATFAEENEWRNRFSAVPFEDKGGTWEARYYQHNAINNVLENIAAGKDRILLTLATGTGKTFIAFQLAWKLFQSRWNLSGDAKRRPRILFLADRNILADQAYNAFSAFPEDALVRIAPDVIRKKGMAPKNGSVFFTIFQTFMTGRDAEGIPSPSFGDYPSDFFDFIVIDECHRGGANDESSWRSILEYFSPAVQLGLTATPKRTANADTYAYFGEPVYVYSLKEGINDGYLTPFKVKQIATTLDEYVYTGDDEVMDGDVEDGKTYKEDDFNRVIEIKEREKFRVDLFMKHVDQRQKTIVFCATQEHALAVRDLINQLKESKDPNYCVRVTAHDGKLGRAAPSNVPGQREDHPHCTHHLEEALYRGGRPERPQHRSHAPCEVHDRVQADRGPWHPPLRWQGLLHHLGLCESLRALQRSRVGR